MRKILGLVGVIIASFLFVLLINNLSAAEIETQAPQRFEFQAVGKFGSYGKSDPTTVHFTVAAICDTANGNLIYISGSSQSSPAIDKGGCAKNPRR